MKMKNGDEFLPNRSESGRSRYVLMQGDKKISLTGCTTILGEQAKPFLINWAASEAYKDSIGKSKAEIEEIIKLKKYAHTQKSNDAKDTGTESHSIVEKFIDHYIATKTYDTSVLVGSDEAVIAAQRFVDWAIRENVEFTQSEISVYHGDYFYAGSFDFICKVKGAYYLGDYKTSKQIDKTYYAQCAAYIKAVNYMQTANEEVKIHFNGVVIVKSTKMKEDQQYMEKAGAGWKKVTIPAFEVEYNTNIETHFIYFLALFTAYRYNKDQEVKFFEKYASNEILTDTQLLELKD